jgi:DNA-binding transcriptional ArsR family regulator
VQRSVTPARFGDLACRCDGRRGRRRDRQDTQPPAAARILRALIARRELSPSEYAREFDEPLDNFAYHAKALDGAGVVEAGATVPRRGAMEHRHSFTGPQAGVAMAMIDLLARV